MIGQAPPPTHYSIRSGCLLSPGVTQLPFRRHLVAWLCSGVLLGGHLAFPICFRRFLVFSALFLLPNAVCWRFADLIASVRCLLGFYLSFSVLTKFLYWSLHGGLASPVLSFLVAGVVHPKWGFSLPGFPPGGRLLVYSPPSYFDGHSAQ